MPCDAFQRMATTDSGYDWERRAFSGDGLCAICWSCYSSLAICCSRSCSGIHTLQCPFRCLWCSCSLSGMVKFPLFSVHWWQTMHTFVTSFIEQALPPYDEVLAHLTCCCWSHEAWSCSCLRNPPLSWDLPMCSRQCLYLMNTRTMFSTWHLVLVFQGKLILNVFGCYGKTIQNAWCWLLKSIDLNIGRAKVSLHTDIALRYPDQPHSTGRSKKGKDLHLVLLHLRTALMSSIHSRWFFSPKIVRLHYHCLLAIQIL